MFPWAKLRHPRSGELGSAARSAAPVLTQHLSLGEFQSHPAVSVPSLKDATWQNTGHSPATESEAEAMVPESLRLPMIPSTVPNASRHVAG